MSWPVKASSSRADWQRDRLRYPDMIRIDAAWLATTPLDMRFGTDTAPARGIAVFGVAQPHKPTYSRTNVPTASRFWCTTASVSGRLRVGSTRALSSGPWRVVPTSRWGANSSMRWSCICPGNAWPMAASSPQSDNCASLLAFQLVQTPMTRSSRHWHSESHGGEAEISEPISYAR